MQNYIRVPDSDTKLFDGNIIILQLFPTTRWVLRYGWYSYELEERMGWYSISIPDNTVRPIVESDLEGVIVVSTEYNSALPPYAYLDNPPHPPYPPVPVPIPPTPVPPKQMPAFFSAALEDQVERAFITVEDIEARDALDKDLMKDGKMVRVNDVDGESRYYIWDATNEVWLDGDIAKVSDILTWTVIEQQ